MASCGWDEVVGIIELLALALALSIDSLGAGIVYGLRRIRVPFAAILTVSMASAVGAGLSVAFGAAMGGAVGAGAARVIGGIILLAMGAWMAWEGGKTESRGKERQRPTDGLGTENLILSLKVRPIGVVIQVMRDPETADFDRSGSISYGEALLLGVALALDGVGSGFGAGMSGASWALTSAAVGCGTFACLRLGIKLGGRAPDGWGGKWIRVCPGLLLMLIGLCSMA